MCPGKRDCLSIKENGIKVKKQKRLILANISEVYELYKEKYPDDNFGISKFYQLRPPWCITVGAAGMHNVCVCATHQNIKLLLHSFPGNVSNKPIYNDLIGKITCNVLSGDCMLRKCESCPSIDNLSKYLQETLNNQGIEN